MAAEIRVPFQMDPHRSVNAKCVREHLSLSNNIYRVPVFFFKTGETARLNITLPVIPPEIHATTPNAKCRIKWGTTLSDTTNAVKWFVKLYSVVWDDAAYTLDPSSGDFSGANGLDTSVTDVSLGAGKPNQCEVTIGNALAVAGRALIGIVERNDGDAGDTLSGSVGIVRVEFIADKA